MKQPKEIVIGEGTMKVPGKEPKKFLRTMTIDRRGDVMVSWYFPKEEKNGKTNLEGKRTEV